MSTATRQVLQVAEQTQRKSNLNGDRRTNFAALESAARVNGGANARRRPRVFVAAENRLLREALSRMLVKNGEIEVVGMNMTEPFRTEDLLNEDTDILLLSFSILSFGILILGFLSSNCGRLGGPYSNCRFKRRPHGAGLAPSSRPSGSCLVPAPIEMPCAATGTVGDAPSLAFPAVSNLR